MIARQRVSASGGPPSTGRWLPSRSRPGPSHSHPHLPAAHPLPPRTRRAGGPRGGRPGLGLGELVVGSLKPGLRPARSQEAHGVRSRGPPSSRGVRPSRLPRAFVSFVEGPEATQSAGGSAQGATHRVGRAHSVSAAPACWGEVRCHLWPRSSRWLSWTRWQYHRGRREGSLSHIRLHTWGLRELSVCVSVCVSGVVTLAPTACCLSPLDPLPLPRPKCAKCTHHPLRAGKARHCYLHSTLPKI